MPKTLGILPGCHDHDHASWYIGPVGHHRDSDLNERSNWAVMIARYREIDPEEHDHEIHRFGHWGVGWVEECAYRPGSAVAAAADEMRASLDAHPILDEDAHSALESEEVSEAWDSWQCREVRQDIVRELVSRIDPSEPADDDMTADEIEEWLDGMTDDQLWELVRECEIRDGALVIRPRDIACAADALIASQATDPTE